MISAKSMKKAKGTSKMNNFISLPSYFIIEKRAARRPPETEARAIEKLISVGILSILISVKMKI